jgi:hypothetical protein
VIESAAEGIAPGDRFYGYYPMASHAVLSAGKVGAGGFTDITPRRTTLPPIYNQYQRIEALPDYRADHHDYWPIFRPLFLTGWLIADQFEDDGDYGADQVLIASASSKTAIGLGFALAQRAGPRPVSIGLTSKANVAALAAQGIYDRVIAYDADAAALPGPERQGFFAPGRSQKRVGDWGAAGFGQRIAEAWLGFMAVAPRIARIDRREGSAAALDAYREMLSGRADPAAGILVVP